MNLARILCLNAANHGDRTALLAGEVEFSYADVAAEVRRIAGRLCEAGIAPGQRVGLAMADHSTHLLAHFAVAWVGGVIVPIDHRWTVSEKARAATAFRTAVVVTDGDDIDGARTMSIGDGTGADPGEPVAALQSDLLVSLSSGTTGRPTGALLTHENLYERFVSQWVAIGYDSRDCFAIVTPLYFGAGRSFGMSLLTAGGSVRLAPPPLTPPEVLAVLQAPGVTATFLPPTLLRRLLPLYDGSPLLPGLDFLIVSGETLFADEAAECLEKVSPNIVSYYASSEGGGISVLSSRQIRDHANTVGVPTFRTEVDIADDEGHSQPPGKVGRLRYRGPGVATRFVDEDGKQLDAGVEGWFYPGDLAERLPGGFLALRGRDKDVIIRGGVNVYPAEVEQVLLGHASIREAAVLGIEDADRGQIVAAFVAGDDLPHTEELSDYCRKKLAPYKVPAVFHIRDELPKTASGKVDKLALLA